MLTLIITLLVASAILTFILMKKGKIADANNNNIPDAIEEKVEAVKEAVAEVKEVVAKAKATKAQATKKTNAKKIFNFNFF